MSMVKINKKIDMKRLPNHIALIMDGNGRWAKKRGLPRFKGHEVGYTKMVMAVKRCAEIGIKICTIFAFSTENWNRPQEELDHIFRLIRDNLQRDTKELNEYGIKVSTMGDVTRFPQDLQEKLHEIKEQTKNNEKCILNLCINYGGRADIVRGVNNLIQLQLNNKKEILGNQKVEIENYARTYNTSNIHTLIQNQLSGFEQVTEETFKKCLYGSDLPDPDLIVRTSGEQRLSNFMLYQMAYSELFFIDTLWPDFNEKLVDSCVVEFQKRTRRFGGVEQ